MEGSVADAVALLADRPQPPTGAASIVLRAIAQEEFLEDNTANQLARHVVVLIENGLPGLCSFLKLNQKSQTSEKYDVLRRAKPWVDGQYTPLSISYKTLD